MCKLLLPLPLLWPDGTSLIYTGQHVSGGALMMIIMPVFHRSLHVSVLSTQLILKNKLQFIYNKYLTSLHFNFKFELWRECIFNSFHRHPIGITVKELNQIIAFHDIEGFLFYESDSSGVHKSLERSSNIELSSYRSCLLIGRNLVQWKSCLSTDENFHIDKLDPKGKVDYSCEYIFPSSFKPIFTHFAPVDKLRSSVLISP